ncbi:MAG: mycothiol-dependent nitroreductase Rv2466c family protein [Actinomycetota bacterium]
MTPIPVRLWIDPGCPWAWQGAVWLRRLADAGVVELDWRIFSLELNSSELDAPFWDACRRKGEALVALALVRRERGNEGFDRLYRKLGNRLHDEKQEISPELVRACADAAGMPDLVDRAVAMPELTDVVRQEFLDARQQSVFGVPTLGIADLKVVYGPVFALAPEGQEAERLWEHTLWMASRPDFFEMKRWPRDIRPGGTSPRTVASIAADP